ncbi:18.6 kDa class III heat shock protein-like [Zingiber officinale]|uniref:18.6 kDa class III heat shock protein-like n=1 Tax=Zingiber officinale TaxID=94328 RepID=UPI001C4DA0F2|nr:18.6 kDa class III heat shock protein-like [Zingiber officinale]
MSLAVAVGPFFDSSVNSLLHLPETMEKISLPPSARRHDDEEEERSLESVPAVDILETAEEYTFIVDVPGLSKADVQVALEEGSKSLVIRGGGKRRRDEEEGCRYLRLERRGPTKFCRRFRMPEDSNSAAISAKCENGVLTVVVGKLPPPVPKKKSVRVSVA